jgi:tetratricopeptide (TPR) repeat protein
VPEKKVMSVVLEKALAEMKEGMSDTQRGYAFQKIAKQLMENLNYLDAVEVLSHAIDAAHVCNFFTQRAQCYKALQKWSEAYYDYSFATRIEPETASHLIQRGLVLTKMFKFDMAVEDLTAGVEIDYAASSYYHRGTVYNEMGKFAEALDDYNTAWGKDAAQAMPNVSFQTKVLNQRALSYFNQGDMASALTDLDAVLLKDVNNHGARLLQSRAYKMNSQLEKAEECCDYIILHDDKEPTFLTERGDIRYRMEEEEKVIEAIHDFDAAIKLLNNQKFTYDEAMHPSVKLTRRLSHAASSPTIHIPGGLNFGESNEPPPPPAEKRGKHHFRGPGALDLVAWGKNMADAHMRRAQAKLFLKHAVDKHAREALLDIKVSIKHVPDNEAYRLTQTICHIRLNEDNHAQAAISRVLELNPRNDRALFHKAFCLSRRGEVKTAIAELSKIINVHDGENLETRAKELHGIPMYRVYEMRATLLHELMAYKLALTDFGRALASNSDSAVNYYLRGDCHSKLGNYEQAYNDFVNADLRGFIDRIALCSARGQVLRLLGDSRRAEKDFTESLEAIRTIRDEEYRRLHKDDPDPEVEKGGKEDGSQTGEGGDPVANAQDEDTFPQTSQTKKKKEEDDEEEELAELPPSVDYFEEVRLMSLRALCLIDMRRMPEATTVLHGARVALRNEEEKFEEMEVTHNVGSDEVELAYNAHKRLEWTVIYHMAECFHSLRRFEDSCRYLHLCVEEFKVFAPDGGALGSAYFFCGMAMNHLSRFVGAEQMLDACLDTEWVRTDAQDRNLGVARFARGKARQGLGDHARALEDFNGALRYCPNDPYVLFRRAWSQKGVGDLTAAAEDFEEAKRLKPNDPNFAVDYKKIQKYEYMCLDEESDFLHPFQSLLRVPTPGAPLPQQLQPPTPRFFVLDATKKPAPVKPRFQSLRASGDKEWALPKSPSKNRLVY